MSFFSAIGLGGTLLPGVLWARSQEGEVITREVLAQAEKVAGLSFTDEERDMMLEGLNDRLDAFAAIRELDIPNAVVPALQFQPAVPARASTRRSTAFRRSRRPDLTRPDRLEDVAFWPVTDLSELIRSGQVTSVELTEMYLERLRRYGPTLECVVTLTEELALAQARRADGELAAGRYRGPLHGIPWGAKDLLSTRGYPTTWGATPYVDQVIEEDATVVRRLDEAGAVLVAKLTLGALASGDVAAVRPDSVRPSDGSVATERWRCRGAWTSLAPCAGASRIARSFWTPSRGMTASIPRPVRFPWAGTPFAPSQP
jgi:Asp-tRNA(Asn)/Glu-tRNA(Gln) amidotransferase C subunit